jgi:hypothetical protein
MTMKSLKWFAVVLVAASLASAPAMAGPIVLTFEGVAATYPGSDAQILSFYSGGTSSAGTSGPNYGISFPENALEICLNTPGIVCSNTSRGGLGDPNSQKGALYFASGATTFLDDPAGFTTGFSLEYAAIYFGGSVDVFSGLDGAGTLLATLSLPITSSGCDASYQAGFCPFVPVGVAFSGTAQSIGFNGTADQIVFDDVTLGSDTPGATPEPASFALLGTGLLTMLGLRRRRAPRS